MERSSGFQLKNDRDYIIMPITSSDLVAFDSNPIDYYEYMRTNMVVDGNIKQQW